MTGNVTVQSVDFVDVSASYTLGLTGTKILDYYTKPSGDTGYTATSVIIYENHLGNKIAYGVSQSVAQIQALFDEVNQVEVDAVITGIGANADGTYNTPSGTNYLDATTTVMDALDELDTTIGAQVTPAVRTNNPTVGANDVNTNIEAVDAAIGADSDLTPVTRTVGQVSLNSTMMAKVEALDTVIGFDAQMSGTPTTVSKTSSIYQNLEALGTYKSVRTIKKTLGWHGAVGTDFVFASAANHTAQNIDLGAIVPAKSRVVDVEIVCTEAYVNSAGASDITFRAGNASAGEQFIASASCDDLNEVVGIVDSTKTAAVIMNWASATNIWIGGDPDQNWDTSTAGKWSIYVTINEFTNI